MSVGDSKTRDIQN